MGKTEEQILQLLRSSKTPLTLAEIAEKLGKEPKVIFRSLQRLFEEGKISSDPKTRRYMLEKEE